MKDLYVQTCTIAGEDGTAHHFDYFVVVGEMQVGGRFACESYGVKVAEPGGDTALVPNITVSVSRIDALMELLVRNNVGPAGVDDVIRDWL